MRRLILRLMCVVSLAFCLAVLALWVRSYRHADSFGNARIDRAQREVHAHFLNSGSGSIYYYRADQTVPPDIFNEASYPSALYRGWHFTTVKSRAHHTTDTFYQRLGFDGYFYRNRVFNLTFRHIEVYVRVPHWLVAGLFALAPAACAVSRLRRFRRDRRAKQGLCAACGYDLRGSPGRCPECGSPAPAAA